MDIIYDKWISEAVPTGSYHQDRKYLKPKSWFRRSAMDPNAVTNEAYADERYITCAAAFPRGSVRLKSALDNVSWGQIIMWPGADYIMVLASAADREEWVKHARELGAVAWYIMPPDQGEVYVHKPYVHVDHSIEDFREQGRPGARGLNHAEIYYDLQAGMTSEQVCRKYDTTRQTISNIRRKFAKLKQTA